MLQTSIPRTKLLYQERGDLHEYKATITNIETLPASSNTPPTDILQDSHVIHLDETIFHVQGGGQPFDLGTISINDAPSSTFNVTSVRHNATSQVEHKGHFTPPISTALAAPTSATLAIDVARRTLNSRIHSAGHILGVAIMRLSRSGTLPPLIETKAKHYPDDASVEFSGLIDGAHKDIIQAAADELVKEARPLTICFWNREECEAKGVALPDKVEGDVFRTVDIEGCGAYACGGTHVKDTQGVGRIIVGRISRKKGQTRVGYSVDDA